jgi:hypothetical protein
METPERIKVDGRRSPDGLIEYWGIATRQPNGRYHCLANVDGYLCIVEVSITAQKEQLNGSDTCPNG